MTKKDRTDYKREYNKDTYKIVKVYIREEDYPAIIKHMNDQGYNKLSGYIKDLIIKDIEKVEKKQDIKIQNNNGKVIVGDSIGTINM